MIAFALLLAATQPNPDLHAEIKFTLGGGEIGKNTYDEAPDHTFTSNSALNIGGNKLTSVLAGKWKNGTLEAFSFTQSGGGNKMTVVLSGSKVTVDAGKEHHVLPYTYKSKLFFTNFHPQLMRNLGGVYASALGGSQKLSLFSLDSGTTLNVATTGIAAKTGHRGNTPETANGFELAFPGVLVNYYTVGVTRTVAMEAKSQQFLGLDAEVTGLFTDPIVAFPELSQATYKTKTLAGLKVPMRDGVHLILDAMLPDAPGKYPVILNRTPYGRKAQMPGGTFYASRGFVYIVQDTRGREDSEGEWDPMVNERKDGFDTVEWIAKQPWCDGNVGMIGASYDGYVQWAAAVEHPQALKCIIPQVSPPDAFLNIPYEYGTLPFLTDLWWLNVVRGKKTDLNLGSLVPKPQGLTTLPLSKLPQATFGYDLPMFHKWLTRESMSDWKGYDIEKDLLSVEIPVLHISGWWDGDGIGTELHWTKLREAGKTNQWLIEGPWTHAFNTTTKLGEYDFGSGAIRDLDSVYLRWFDTWLKGKQVGLDKMAKATVFMTGENKWHETADFPEAGAKPMTWFLSADGSMAETPGVGESKYTYDPHNAKVPDLPKPFSTDISLAVPFNEKAKDSVTFRTASLTEDTSFEGSLTFKGYIRTDVVDTDLYVMLLDVAPNGTQLATTAIGKLRLAYRNGFAKPELMTPGQVYAVTVRPWWYAHRFKKGHQIAIKVMSSAFPGTARNLNTGEPIANATRMVTAHIELLHDKDHPSSLTWNKLDGS